MFNLFPSLNLIRSWKEVSAGWKNVRQDFSDRAVHNLRVATRRMIVELEVASAVAPDRKAHRLIRKLKKMLKRLGPLRETQVHLLKSRLGTSKLASQFSIFLKEREAEEIRYLRRRMREETRKSLRTAVLGTNRKLRIAVKGTPRSVLRDAIEAKIDKRLDAVMTADAFFRRSSSIEDFHRMRVQFKRLRYAAELAKPIIGCFTNQQMDGMRKIHRTMGEIHDLQTYMTALSEWSGRRPPRELQKEYDTLMKAFKARPAWLQEFNFRDRP